MDADPNAAPPRQDDVVEFLLTYPEIVPFFRAMLKDRRVIVDIQRQVVAQGMRLTDILNDKAQLARELDDAKEEIHRVRSNLGAALMILGDENKPRTAYNPDRQPAEPVPSIEDMLAKLVVNPGTQQ